MKEKIEIFTIFFPFRTKDTLWRVKKMENNIDGRRFSREYDIIGINRAFAMGCDNAVNNYVFPLNK